MARGPKRNKRELIRDKAPGPRPPQTTNLELITTNKTQDGVLLIRKTEMDVEVVGSLTPVSWENSEFLFPGMPVSAH